MKQHKNTRTTRAPRLASALALVLVASALAAAIAPCAALAGQWTEAFCQAPNGAAATSEGWSPFSEGGAGYGSDASTGCGPGTPMLALLSSAATAPVGSLEGLAYAPPAGSTLAGGELDLTVSADGYGYGASGVVAVYTPAFQYNGNVIFQCANGEQACPNGSYDWTGVVGLPADRGGNLYVGASCGGIGGQECDEGANDGAWALGELFWADLLLNTSATPAASAIGGTLLEANARGSQDMAMTATDSGGPGVYAIAVQVEGHTLYDGVPDTNSGRCVPSGEYASTLVFDFAQPCASSASVDIPIETAALTDGKHVLKVTVTDAASDSSVVYDGQISTLNAPENSAAPVVTSSGEVQVGGAALSATPGSWSAPAGAGTPTYQYQWQDCNGEGAACGSIAGAERSTYTPAPSDVGHTLRVLVTGADNDGFEQAASAPTAAVAAATTTQGAPNGPGATNPTETPATTTTATATEKATATPTTTNTTPATTPTTTGAGQSAAPVETTVPASTSLENGVGASQQAVIRLGVPRDLSRGYGHRALAIKGRLLSARGQAITGAQLDVMAQQLGSSHMETIGHADSGRDGNFTARVPAGPSRIIELAYRAYSTDTQYAALAKVTEAVRAGVRLHITPRHIGPHGTVVLSGRVLGHVPRKGVVVELLVHYRGRWEPFRDPRASADGRFRAVYQFEGAIGRFPFKAQVLAAQSSFDYTSGESQTVDVQSG